MTKPCPPLLTVSNLSVSYGSKKAVDSVSFQAYPGELTAVIGNNGCGKTSLLKAILNLLPHQGKSRLSDYELESLTPRKRAALISYVPQKSGINISMTVHEVCLLGFNPRLGLLQSPTPSMKARAAAVLDTVGLQGLEGRDFLTLSEGQKQLCILARTLIEDAPLILMDEPDSSLDFSNRHLLMEQIQKIVCAEKCALVCIHSPELALRYCDRILLMKDGRLTADLNLHTASLDELNEKLALVYHNIQIAECPGAQGKMHRVVLAL